MHKRECRDKRLQPPALDNPAKHLVEPLPHLPVRIVPSEQISLLRQHQGNADGVECREVRQKHRLLLPLAVSQQHSRKHPQVSRVKCRVPGAARWRAGCAHEHLPCSPLVAATTALSATSSRTGNVSTGCSDLQQTGLSCSVQLSPDLICNALTE
ncbi:hypothetical protein BC831DRAFT_475006 [Entophlyctis helioformis]|nr:hypothetical protein BC831DRAFT_475006 [Entophlyctis helioformis]